MHSFMSPQRIKVTLFKVRVKFTAKKILLELVYKTSGC